MHLDFRLKELLMSYEKRILALEELVKNLEDKVVRLQKPATKRSTKTVDKS